MKRSNAAIYDPFWQGLFGSIEAVVRESSGSYSGSGGSSRRGGKDLLLLPQQLREEGVGEEEEKGQQQEEEEAKTAIGGRKAEAHGRGQTLYHRPLLWFEGMTAYHVDQYHADVASQMKQVYHQSCHDKELQQEERIADPVELSSTALAAPTPAPAAMLTEVSDETMQDVGRGGRAEVAGRGAEASSGTLGIHSTPAEAAPAVVVGDKATAAMAGVETDNPTTAAVAAPAGAPAEVGLGGASTIDCEKEDEDKVEECHVFSFLPSQCPGSQAVFSGTQSHQATQPTPKDTPHAWQQQQHHQHQQEQQQHQQQLEPSLSQGSFHLSPSISLSPSLTPFHHSGWEGADGAQDSEAAHGATQAGAAACAASGRDAATSTTTAAASATAVAAWCTSSQVLATSREEEDKRIEALFALVAQYASHAPWHFPRLDPADVLPPELLDGVRVGEGAIAYLERRLEDEEEQRRQEQRQQEEEEAEEKGGGGSGLIGADRRSDWQPSSFKGLTLRLALRTLRPPSQQQLVLWEAPCGGVIGLSEWVLTMLLDYADTLNEFRPP